MTFLSNLLKSKANEDLVLAKAQSLKIVFGEPQFKRSFSPEAARSLGYALVGLYSDATTSPNLKSFWDMLVV